jgi:hypothetical protein
MLSHLSVFFTACLFAFILFTFISFLYFSFPPSNSSFRFPYHLTSLPPFLKFFFISLSSFCFFQHNFLFSFSQFSILLIFFSSFSSSLPVSSSFVIQIPLFNCFLLILPFVLHTPFFLILLIYISISFSILIFSSFISLTPPSHPDCPCLSSLPKSYSAFLLQDSLTRTAVRSEWGRLYQEAVSRL